MAVYCRIDVKRVAVVGVGHGEVGNTNRESLPVCGTSRIHFLHELKLIRGCGMTVDTRLEVVAAAIKPVSSSEARAHRRPS